MSHDPTSFINAWISDSSYPGFKHRSFNLRIGRNCAVGGDVAEAQEKQKEATSSFLASNPGYQFSPFPNDPRYPLIVPSHWIHPRSLTLSLHVRYGKQLFAIRPDIEWIRKQRKDLRP